LRIRLSSLLAFGFVLLFFADRALAWGPAVHIGLGGSILENLALLPAGLAAILGRERLAYLYGNIAADIVFAKRLSRVKQACHHWSTAFRLLDGARDDRANAFAYGYLSHLAADTVAHGKYVPRQIILSGSTLNFGHLYWELRADATESEENWRQLERLLAEDHSHDHVILAPHITETFLSYELNRQLFDRMNALAARRSFRRTMGVWSRCSRWYLSPALMHGYRRECIDRILSVLSEGTKSPLLQEDPNGTSALMRLRIRRREHRRLRRQGVSLGRRIIETSQAYEPSAGYLSSPPEARTPSVLEHIAVR